VTESEEKTRVTAIVQKPLGGGEGGKGSDCLVVIYTKEPTLLGKRFVLDFTPVRLGRGAENHIVLEGDSVSRRHAHLEQRGSVWWAVDDGSTNGTYVNDEQIRRQRLRDGDQMRIGRSILKFMTGENVEVHYHEEIYRLMTVDALTQIFNRRYFNEALDREFNRSRRYGRALSLIAFDIDHFKRVNDTYGHLAGDNLLRQLAAAVKQRLRREDVFARTGGEEFGVLLPEVGLDGARATADKVRRIVEVTPVKHEQQLIGCAISVGVATLGDSDVSGEELYRRADQRLYEAKQGGRNRVAG